MLHTGDNYVNLRTAVVVVVVVVAVAVAVAAAAVVVVAAAGAAEAAVVVVALVVTSNIADCLRTRPDCFFGSLQYVEEQMKQLSCRLHP